MAIKKPLTPESPWVEVKTTKKDWDDASPEMLKNMVAQMHLIRAFEEKVLDLAGQKLINGPAHSSIGQEGGAVAGALGLRPTDHVNGSHRGHHQFLAKAFNFAEPEGITATDQFSQPVREILTRTLAEICGLTGGFSGGRGGSMHLMWKEAGAMGTNAIVGGAVPFASGFAWAHRHAKTEGVSVTYFGDGAINIGSVLETMNLAAAWKLPLCFFVENNLYAVSTTTEEATGDPRLSVRGMGFNIPSWRVDGMDPLAVYLANEEALAHMRAGKGPTLIEAEVYRYFHQNGPFPGSAFGYRSKDEESDWRGRDPIVLTESHLERREIMTRDELDQLRSRSKAIMEEVAGEMLEADPNGKGGTMRFKLNLWPDPATVDVGIRSDLSEMANVTYKSEADLATVPTKEVKFVEVVAEVMGRRMEEDPRIVCMGEDIHKLNGGPRGATKGLAQRFPDRTLGTPISEAAFTGLGGGLALDGRYIPVVELMYADFIWVAADQLFNQIGKARHMFGGEHPMRLVMRVKVGTKTGYGSQHSMDPSGIMATSVGWRIAAPSTAIDYIGMMNSALLVNDPVVVLEHDADLYNQVVQVPDGELDFYTPIGKAAVRRSGSEATVLTYMSMVSRSLQAVENLGRDVEVIDLRWLDRGSIDWDTIGESIRKTNRVVIVEQGSLGTSYGGWLADEIQRRFFDYLDAPVSRVHGSESSPTISKALETAALADIPEIEKGLTDLLSGVHGGRA
jgi:2-oxoisovalerate dehydrogenase E1 component